MLRIKELLKTKGITGKELASRLGISEGALSATINGNPTLERLTDIATALNVEVSELFTQPKQGVISCPHCGKPINIKVE